MDATIAPPSNPHATSAECARFAAFAAALEKDGFSPITRACYASDWFTVSELAHRATGRRFRLAGFTPDAFALQRAALSAQGSSPATLNRRLSFLRRYAAFAARTAPELAEVAKGFATLPFQHAAKRTTKALTHTQEEALRAAADAQGTQCAALIAVFLGTGLRAAEVAELRRGDVTGPASAPTALRIGGPRPKTALLGPFAQPRLAALLAEQPRGADRPLFAGRSGAALGEDGLASMVDRAARAASVDATPRTLRHTFAVRYLSEHRDDLGGLAQALGHAGIAAVRAYRAEAEARGPVVESTVWGELEESSPTAGVRRRVYAGARVVIERDVVAPRAALKARAFQRERVTIVISGRVAVRAASRRIEAGAGALVTVPAGVVHDLVTVGETPAVLLHVCAQGRRGGDVSAVVTAAMAGVRRAAASPRAAAGDLDRRAPIGGRRRSVTSTRRRVARGVRS